MKTNSYTTEAKEVMEGLIKLMCVETDMKRFKNIAAVYVFWQNDLHWLEQHL